MLELLEQCDLPIQLVICPSLKAAVCPFNFTVKPSYSISS
jgi:hypothetical protein